MFAIKGLQAAKRRTALPGPAARLAALAAYRCDDAVAALAYRLDVAGFGGAVAQRLAQQGDGLVHRIVTARLTFGPAARQQLLGAEHLTRLCAERHQHVDDARLQLPLLIATLQSLAGWVDQPVAQLKAISPRNCLYSQNCSLPRLSSTTPWWLRSQKGIRSR
ncbi:hypothetical protein RQP53_11835 [Paucibacter sp. APW11]|uniref:Uncharacterized protein n=1 Tax=Roseateles aquae TaxID=3077235 RepID=A0ABU3PBL2_9BURK|nr:hypothetical protein [Paucibacter sp. APW11]MDT8999955.1 hypothetical protein [Paucibacter sp. APW11]